MHFFSMKARKPSQRNEHGQSAVCKAVDKFKYPLITMLPSQNSKNYWAQGLAISLQFESPPKLEVKVKYNKEVVID